MCADYTPSRRERMQEQFELDLSGLDMDVGPRALPGWMAPIIRAAHDVTSAIECVPAMFGMVPHWADFKLARNTYNARTETVAIKPSYRNAWKRRQFCIIPADNFYEWSYENDPEDKKGERWQIMAANDRPLGIAGIWEWRANGPDGQPLISCSMLTVNAENHELMKRFHKSTEEKRMAVILEPSIYRPWLNNSLTADEVYGLLKAYSADMLTSAPAPLPSKVPK